MYDIEVVLKVNPKSCHHKESLKLYLYENMDVS